MTALRTWAGNHTYPASVVHRPASVEELRDLVQRTPRLRAVGSRHCFNDVVDAPELVSLDALPGDVDVDAGTRTVRVPAAVRYGDLAARLHAGGWALANLASLPHISVAGAVATGTHGSGDVQRCLSAAVRGLELVTADGDLLVLTEDDDELAGAVVGLGALGIVTTLTLEIEPTYDVAQVVHERVPWTLVLERFDDVMSSADSVSLFTDWTGDDVAQVWRKARAGRPLEDADGLGLRATTPLHPVPGIDAASTTEQLAVAGSWHTRLPHFRLDHTPSAGAELQSEYLLDRRDAAAAIEVLRGLAPRTAPLLLVSEVRTVAADDLWLSMATGRDSVALHFTWKPQQDDVVALLRQLEAALAPFDPRPHWGKLFAAAGRYPRVRDFQALRERLDPQGRFLNPYLERHVLAATAG